MSTISINEFLSCLSFRTVAYIEPVSNDGQRDALPAGFGEPASVIRFIGASTLLCKQPLEYFIALAHGRMLTLNASSEGDKAQTRLIPMAAIHHFEIGPGVECDSELDREGGSPEARIVYRAVDPACPDEQFQMPVAASLIDELLDSDTAPIIDIGRGKFVFADDVEDARPLNTWQISRHKLAQETDGVIEPPVSVIALRSGGIIPSSFHARTIEGMIGRLLPSAHTASEDRRSAPLGNAGSIQVATS